MNLPLCRLFAIQGAWRALKEARASPASFLARHVNGDWGDVDEHDRNENEFALKNGFRILSCYTLSNGERIWIITEADRSSTCILLPDEY